jgi:hypothetical protein
MQPAPSKNPDSGDPLSVHPTKPSAVDLSRPGAVAPSEGAVEQGSRGLLIEGPVQVQGGDVLQPHPLAREQAMVLWSTPASIATWRCVSRGQT